MTDRKVILWSLLIPVSLSLLTILRYGDIDSGVILFLVLLFALWGGGLFVGLLLYAFLYKHKKPNPWNYLFGEIIVFGGFYAAIFYFTMLGIYKLFAKAVKFFVPTHI